MPWSWLDWAAVAALGAIVGASELISRYRDHPGAALKTWPAIVYIGINGAASAGALGLIQANGWFAQSHWTQILMAGVSAMALFCTSLFIVRAGDRDVGVGPGGFLQIFLTAADRAVASRNILGTSRRQSVKLVEKGQCNQSFPSGLPSRSWCCC